MHHALNTQTKMSCKQLLKMFKVNVSLSQISWKVVPKPKPVSELESQIEQADRQIERDAMKSITMSTY